MLSPEPFIASPLIALLFWPFMALDWPIMPPVWVFLVLALALSVFAGAIAFWFDIIELLLDIAEPDIALVLDCMLLPSASAAVLHMRPSARAVEINFMGLSRKVWNGYRG